MSIRVVGDKILAQFKKVEAPSGILLPDHLKPKVTDEDATVLSVGEEVTEIKVGDKVIFNPQSALLVELQGNTYILLTKKGVIGVVE